jgi:hypothetical protein
MTQTLTTLRRDGIAPVYPSLGPGPAAEVAAYLRASPCYNEHCKVYSDQVARSFDDTAAIADVWCHDLETIVLAPHVWDLAISLLPSAAAYLEARPRLYSLNAFWSRAGAAPPMAALQTWHRDRDDERFLALFIYGTDVLTEADGPHRFQLGSHDPRRHPVPFAPPVYGPAGTAFLADTRGLHMGVKPTSPEPRLIIWARWGISDRPWAYEQDKLAPVDASRLGDRYPEDAETRDLVRLVAT